MHCSVHLSRIGACLPQFLLPIPILLLVLIARLKEIALQILVYGQQRFMGYMYDEDQTKKAIDDMGWLHTGDIGFIDSDGFLFITGRMNGRLLLHECIQSKNRKIVA